MLFRSLLAALAVDAGQLLGAHLPALLSGRAAPLPQVEGSSYATKLGKEMSRLDASRPALELHRRVRALKPWPGAEFQLRDTVIKVGAVGAMRPTADPAGTLRWSSSGALLACGDGTALELTLLQRPGKPMQPAAQALQAFGPTGCEKIS